MNKFTNGQHVWVYENGFDAPREFIYCAETGDAFPSYCRVHKLESDPSSWVSFSQEHLYRSKRGALDAKAEVLKTHITWIETQVQERIAKQETVRQLLDEVLVELNNCKGI